MYQFYFNKNDVKSLYNRNIDSLRFAAIVLFAISVLLPAVKFLKNIFYAHHWFGFRFYRPSV